MLGLPRPARFRFAHAYPRPRLAGAYFLQLFQPPLEPLASRAPPCLFDPARTFFLIRFPISRTGIVAGIDRVTLSRARVYSAFNEESGPMGLACFRPTSWNLEVFDCTRVRSSAGMIERRRTHNISAPMPVFRQ